ncbi:hypothetical protein D3C75_1164400 [compost metagenome]
MAAFPGGYPVYPILSAEGGGAFIPYGVMSAGHPYFQRVHPESPGVKPAAAGTVLSESHVPSMEKERTGGCYRGVGRVSGDVYGYLEKACFRMSG